MKEESLFPEGVNHKDVGTQTNREVTSWVLYKDNIHGKHHVKMIITPHKKNIC